MNIMKKNFSDENELDNSLAYADEVLIEFMRELDGDIIILGIGGKMGISLGLQAMNATKMSGVKKRIIGVSRFKNEKGKQKLLSAGIETISCDLLNRDEVNRLPDIPNVIFMAGRKFGTEGAEELTWAMNTIVPANVAEKFKNSKIVVFSTGCVYPLVDVKTGGCTEETKPDPIGEYAVSCLGRERIFEYYAAKNNTSVLIYRLNYAVDLRYGILNDIGWQVWKEEKVNNSVGYFNVIWQGDATSRAIMCLKHTKNPYEIMNITGPETIPVSYVAEKFGKLMKKNIIYTGEPGTKCYLNNAAKSFKLFGYPKVSLDEMIEVQAHWIMSGKPSLGRPTHFEVNNGKF